MASCSQGGVIFPIQTTGVPQMHAGAYFLNRLQEDATSLHGCHIFSNKLQGALQVHMGGSYFPNTEGATSTVHKALSTYLIIS